MLHQNEEINAFRSEESELKTVQYAHIEMLWHME
jgi:hypothetical protein